MNSTVLPSFRCGINRQCFAAARLTWPAYDDGRKRENSSAWKDHIIVASTCRRSVEFGCYATWLWMATCVSVMTEMLALYNFTIPCHGRRAWKTSREACASAGSRFWLVESILFGDHVWCVRCRHRYFLQIYCVLLNHWNVPLFCTNA